MHGTTVKITTKLSHFKKARIYGTVSFSIFTTRKMIYDIFC